MPLRLRTSPRPIDRTFDVNVKKAALHRPQGAPALQRHRACDPKLRAELGTGPGPARRGHPGQCARA